MLIQTKEKVGRSYIPEKTSGINIMLEPSFKSPGPHKEVPSEKKLQSQAHTRPIIRPSTSLLISIADQGAIPDPLS